MPSNNTEKLKLPKIFEKVQGNENSIENIEVINIRNQDVAYNKKLNRLILLKDHLVTGSSVSTSLIVNVDFGIIPEYVIDFSKVHTLLHTTDAFEINEFLFYSTNHLWKQVGNSYILKYFFRGALAAP